MRYQLKNPMIDSLKLVEQVLVNRGIKFEDINRFKFQNDFTQQAAGTLIKAYGSDYDTIVEYKNLGLMEQ